MLLLLRFAGRMGDHHRNRLQLCVQRGLRQLLRRVRKIDLLCQSCTSTWWDQRGPGVAKPSASGSIGRDFDVCEHASTHSVVDSSVSRRRCKFRQRLGLCATGSVGSSAVFVGDECEHPRIDCCVLSGQSDQPQSVRLRHRAGVSPPFTFSSLQKQRRSLTSRSTDSNGQWRPHQGGDSDIHDGGSAKLGRAGCPAGCCDGELHPATSFKRLLSSRLRRDVLRVPSHLLLRYSASYS